MRRLACLIAALTAAWLAASAPARAHILVTIDKYAQRMTVTVDGDPRYVWPVATGIARYDTPNGRYRPFRMERKHFSRQWDWAPMPYSIFFTKQGHAIHGTSHTISGAPASHGCVRLSVEHAATLWRLVKAQGMKNVRVELDGRIPTHTELAARRARGDDTVADVAVDPAAGDPTELAAAEPEPEDAREDAREVPRVGHGWARYRAGRHTYYYRVDPPEMRRIYRRVYRLYRSFRFPW
jgi:hypothetical protein